MTTSDMIRELCDRMNISLAELCRRIGQTPQNFNKKLQRGTVSVEEMIIIADVLGVTFEQRFIIEDGINRNATHESCSVSGLPIQPKIMSDNDYKAIAVTTVDKKSLEDAISELQDEHDSIKCLKPRNIDNFDDLNKELQTISETIDSFEQKASEWKA